MQDILYDPQTSGGLLIAVKEEDGQKLIRELKDSIPCAEIIGYVTEKQDNSILLHP